jgi:alkanesulfonate monooxygenase SsuD/methylene tetrahydromethanopterin reductase-like flavin-dependent oxidoreductase (luciferase family)
MRIGTVTIPSAAETGSNVVDYVTTVARQAEALGFHGVWVTDAFARGKPTLDPLILLGALATHTSRIELGTCVVQVPLRHPVEHAHRVLTLTALAQGRFRFGVGSGSTRNDFDAVQADFDARFKTLTSSLEVMRRVWGGEPVYGPALSVWPGTEGGPPVLLGAWRNERWINLSAKVLQGWIASGIYTSWDDLAVGLKMFRKAGGKRALLAISRSSGEPADRACTEDFAGLLAPGGKGPTEALGGSGHRRRFVNGPARRSRATGDYGGAHGLKPFYPTKQSPAYIWVGSEDPIAASRTVVLRATQPVVDAALTKIGQSEQRCHRITDVAAAEAEPVLDLLRYFLALAI